MNTDSHASRAIFADPAVNIHCSLFNGGCKGACNGLGRLEDYTGGARCGKRGTSRVYGSTHGSGHQPTVPSLRLPALVACTGIPDQHCSLQPGVPPVTSRLLRASPSAAAALGVSGRTGGSVWRRRCGRKRSNPGANRGLLFLYEPISLYVRKAFRLE